MNVMLILRLPCIMACDAVPAMKALPVQDADVRYSKRSSAVPPDNHDTLLPPRQRSQLWYVPPTGYTLLRLNPSDAPL